MSGIARGDEHGANSKEKEEVSEALLPLLKKEGVVIL